MTLIKVFILFLCTGYVSAQVSAWGQCGGIGYTGSSRCVSGYCCSYTNQYYSQCIPGGGCSAPSGATTKTTTTTTTTAPTAVATLCDQFAYVASSNGYFLNNNKWGMSSATSGSQCTYYNGISGSGIAWSTKWTWNGGTYNVKSYPSSGKSFTPKTIAAISSMPTTMKWSYSTSNIVANVAYDLFTSANQNNPNSGGDFELMIWLAAYGGAGPISATGSPIATVRVANQLWKLYYGLNGTMKVYTFVFGNGVLNSFSGDVKDFFNYLITNHGFPSSTQYLITFAAGTEPFTGGPATFTVSQFAAAVN